MKEWLARRAGSRKNRRVESKKARITAVRRSMDANFAPPPPALAPRRRSRGTSRAGRIFRLVYERADEELRAHMRDVLRWQRIRRGLFTPGQRCTPALLR